MPRHGPGGFMMIYIVEGGPGRGKDMTAQGLGTHPG